MNMKADISFDGTEQETVPIHDAEALTGAGRQAMIVLRGKIYTLRITRQGKLLLTK